MKPILEGVKILDLSTLLPGPFSTQILADMGAEVIKVENPKGGDFARHMFPVKNVDGGQFLAINRNKRSIALNLREEEGKKVFLKMVETADVVFEQYRPGVMARMGLSYEELKAVNPRIIMLSLSSFGQDGPCVFDAGHDINFLSRAGVIDLSGERGKRAAVPAVQMSDVAGGTFLSAMGITAALYNRERTGEGCHIDVSLTDAAISFAVALIGAYSVEGRIPERSRETFNGGHAWYTIYTCKDGREVSLGSLEPKFWANFCKGIGREDFIARYSDPDGDGQAQLEAEVQEVMATKTADEWVEVFKDIDCPFTKVNNLAEALQDEYFKARGMIVEMDHPTEGHFTSVGLPVRFVGMEQRENTVPPALGQQTDEILSEYGYKAEDIAALREAGVIK